MSHRIILMMLILGVCWPGTQVQAEVRSFTDAHGDYIGTRILTLGPQAFGSAGPQVWTPVRPASRGGGTLNPFGDRWGDSWPVIADSEHAPFQAWAVWSRLDGLDYDLVWSRWNAGGWEAVSWIQPGQVNAGDDLDPDLAYDSTARPYLAWWRNENGQGRVYLSMFLVTQWMIPYLVSESGVDGRFPVIEIRPDGEILVTYETTLGLVEQTVYFNEPVTITDDIDPLDHVSDGGTRYVPQANP